MRYYVIGNGPSLTPEILDSLIGKKCYAVNRIWKMFDKTEWRPTDYVRCEMPEYNRNAVVDDIREMSKIGCVMHLQKGFDSLQYGKGIIHHEKTRFELFETCEGNEKHLWHLPKVCGYGTVVNIAIQLAVLDGASEIVLYGCDLGMPSHFYGEEGRNSDDLADAAHGMAVLCSPIRIFNASGGNMKWYERIDEKESIHGNE